MKNGLRWTSILALCLILAAALVAKDPPKGSVARQDLLDRLDSGREGAGLTADAGLKLAHARDLIATGQTERATDLLGQIARMKLPADRAADKILTEAYLLLGNLYRDAGGQAAAKAVHFYGGAIQHMSPEEDGGLMASTLRTISGVYTGLGDTAEAARFDDLARDVETGVATLPLDLGLTPSCGGLEDAGDDTCDASVMFTFPYKETMTVAFSGDHNWRHFTLTEPTVVRLETISPDTFGDDTDLTLYGGCDAGTPTDFLVFDDDDGPGFLSLIELCLDVGTYYVEIGGFNDSATPDDFDFEATAVDTCVVPPPDQYEPDNEFSQATPIGFRNNGVGQGGQFGRDNKQIQSHTIFPRGETDFVKFSLSRPNFVRIETSGEDNPDTVIGMSNSGGLLLAVDDDGGTGLGSRLDFCLPQGDWYVATIGFNAVDFFEYDIAVDVEFPCLFESEPNATCDLADPVEPGQTISGLQTPAGVAENDYYVFTLEEERQVTIETDGWDIFDVDTFLELYDGCPGDLLLSDDDAGPGFLSLIQTVLPAGTYYVNVTVSPFSVGASFPYDLTITTSVPPLTETEPNDTCATANPTLLGDNLLAAISPAGDRDNFLLTTGADTFVEIETMGPSGDTVLQIQSADGSTVIGCNDDDGPGLFSMWGCCLPAGNYCVTVRDFGDNSTISSYNIEFRDLGMCTPTDPPSCPVDGLGCPF